MDLRTYDAPVSAACEHGIVNHEKSGGIHQELLNWGTKVPNTAVV